MTKLVPSAISKGEIEGCPRSRFETWDPSNQFLLETPSLLFVIPSEGEGSAVSLNPKTNVLVNPKRFSR
jgi:hypothetical protein